MFGLLVGLRLVLLEGGLELLELELYVGRLTKLCLYLSYLFVKFAPL
jgi:hypothetical protein